MSPDGNYLIALNKLSHGRHLHVGPSQPEASQLVDISQDKMKILMDAFTEPEPHYAQTIKADKIKPVEVYPKEENKHPLAVWDVNQAGVTRQGNRVTAKMVSVRSTFYPNTFEVNEGDVVTLAVTNIEQTTDELHGFGLLDYNINIVIDPGETKTVTFTANKRGRVPVLLHELLLGPAPGDAGVLHRETAVARVPVGPAPSSGGRAREVPHVCLRRSVHALSPPAARRRAASAARGGGAAHSRRPLLPLWNLTMFAPQYPDGLRLDIYDHALVGGNSGQDVKEINLLNHYIGMRDLAVEDFTEFQWMPFAFGGIALLFLRAAVLGTVKEMVDAVVVFVYFGGSRSGRSATACTATDTTSRPTRP